MANNERRLFSVVNHLRYTPIFYTRSAVYEMIVCHGSTYPAEQDLAKLYLITDAVI